MYQQGIGDSAPEVTIRGLRGLEIATTLDDVPTQDLEAPGAFYLSNNLGGVFTTSEISGVSIYPGVAYPDKNTFGTIGGTVAYQTLRPSNDAFIDVTGTVGSFGTYKEGIVLNSGSLDSPLGTGDNALKVLAQYNNFQTQGFIDGTPNRENEFYAAFDKPYDDGLSKFQATFIYNTANGLIENEPVPPPYLQKYGTFSNSPTTLDFARQNNDYGTIILRDDTYINDFLQVGGNLFYIHNDNQLESYASPTLFEPGNPNTVNGAAPFINNPAGFGEGVYYGPANPAPLGLFGGGVGGLFYGNGNRYNPAMYYNNKQACPTAIINANGGSPVGSICGLNDEVSGNSADTYGIQPRITIIAPEYFGVANTIKIGGLAAHEEQPTGFQYLGGLPNTPQSPQNASNERLGGTERTIFQGYVQDKIDVLDDTLHLTPGFTLEATHSSFVSGAVFGSLASPAYGPNGLFSGLGNANVIDQYGPYKAVKYDKQFLPFFNISYDFDKLFPVLKGVSAYGSVANSAVFAPVGDFGPNSAGPPPYASVVHLYEGGVKYNTSNVSLNIDYFYQKVDRDFGFFEFQSGPDNGKATYSDFGQREFKGFEAAVTWQITPNWQLFANGSHLLAKYLNTYPASDTVAEDQYGLAIKGPQTGIPDWLSTFGADYSNKSMFRDGDVTNVRLTGQYTGHQNTSYDFNDTAYLNPGIQFPGLPKLNNFAGCQTTSTQANPCGAYIRYNEITGETTYDPNGGIAPFVVFNLDASYTLPTPFLPVIKRIVFDLNIQNLFDERYFQYFYKQISPGAFPAFTSGPFGPHPLAGSPGTIVPGLARNNYSGAEFADGIPGQPFSAFFSVTARF